MIVFTRVQRRILSTIEQQGGVATSLYALTDDLDINYSHAYHAVYQLALLGLVEIIRTGRCLQISLSRASSNDDTETLSGPVWVSAALQNRPATNNQQGECMEYVRPDLSDEEKAKIGAFAVALAANGNGPLRMTSILKICLENGRLLKEVNDLRAQLGIDPLPVIDPTTGRPYVRK